MDNLSFDQFAIDRIRGAVRLLEEITRDFHDPSRGSSDTYGLLSAAIEEKTGVMVPKERLRQFARGYPDKTDSTARKWPVLKHDRLKAVADFVTDEDDPASPLAKADLEISLVSPRAISALKDYFECGGPQGNLLSLKSLKGTFVHTRAKSRFEERTTLELQPYQDSLRAILSIEFFEHEAADDLAGCAGLSTPENQETYAGWAMIDPEDKLIMLMRGQADQQSTVGLTIAFDAEALSGRVIEEFYAIVSSSGIWIEPNSSQTEEHVGKYLQNALKHFRRV